MKNLQYLLLLTTLFLFTPFTSSAQLSDVTDTADAVEDTEDSSGDLLADDFGSWDLHSPHFGDGLKKKWRFRDDINLSFSHNSGNTRSFSIGGANEFIASYNAFLNNLSAGIFYSQTSSIPNTPLSVVGRHIYVDEDLEWHFHHRYYGIAGFDWQTDKPNGMNSRYATNAGLGVFIVETKKVVWRLEGSYHFSHEDQTNVGVDQSLHSFLSAMRFYWIISQHLNWDNEIESITELTNGKNTRLNYTSSLGVNVSKNFVVSLNFILRFDNEPVFGYKKYDTNTTASLGIKF